MKLADSLLICESVLLENEKSKSKNSSKIKIKQLLEIESNNKSVNNQLPVITEEVLVICCLLLFLEGIDSFFFLKGISNTLVHGALPLVPDSVDA